MKQEKADRVYSCCGQYIAVRSNLSGKIISCPRCGGELKTPLKNPKILIVTK